MNNKAPDSARASNLKSDTYLRWRLIKDAIASRVVGIGGMSVIIFIALIFFYLAYVVLPLFKWATIEQLTSYSLANNSGQTVHLAMEEQTEIAVRFSDDGQVTFFRAQSGALIQQTRIVVESADVTSFGAADPSQALVGYGLSDGTAIVFKHHYRVTFPDGKRVITPEIRYPLSETAIEIDDEGQPLTKLALQDNEEEATIAATTADHRLILVHLLKETSFLDDSVTLERSLVTLPQPSHPVDYILIDKNQSNLYAIAENGEITSYDISDKEEPRFVERIRVVPNGASITAIKFLTGDISILVGDSSGSVTQWSLVRGEDNISRLTRIRDFNENTAPIAAIAPEYARKGYLTADKNGHIGIFHTTAHRTLLVDKTSNTALDHIAVSPRANAMLTHGHNGEITFWRIDNEHPEVSWSSLWGKVWYENYSEPAYIWQSSSASDDFEPKFSLVPITFGTLKAAFYAMLIAIPLALFGALYTAQFMAPRMRRTVKPSIEIMEALPTVILGFLAGLWLAPYVEKHLPGVFAILIILPVGILLAAYTWSLMPRSVRLRVPDGWEAALLLPVIIFIIWVSVTLSPALEAFLFGGDIRLWLTNEMGVGFDQRNAIVVGIAMGFAVIPTIFSIAEDAVFGVPKHLVQGSLALGATPWQTMIRVVLLTASPGIFSAIMIGLGRAVGETMIVLMATGNTPVMDFSPFEGLRTLSANIAVELPESEVDSTHFRILFLAGLVLFLFTFFVNTLAELVRQRLRKKYSTL